MVILAQYEVLEEDNLIKLEASLREYFRGGWQLAGGIAIKHSKNRNGPITHTYLQAIYR